MHANTKAYAVACLATYIQTYMTDIDIQTLTIVCQHIRVHIYMETCMPTLVHVWLNTYIHMHIILIHACLHIYQHMYIHTLCMYGWIDTWIQT